MGRFVSARPRATPRAVVAAAETARRGDERDDAMQRIVKYIPTEMVSGYAFLLGLTQAAPSESQRFWAGIAIFCIMLVVTPTYLIRVHKPQSDERPQVWVATVAFVLWAYAMGGPFSLGPIAPYYQGWLGGLLVGLYSWLVGIFYVP